MAQKPAPIADIDNDEHDASLLAKRVIPVGQYGDEVGKGNIPGTSRFFISATNLEVGPDEELIWEAGGPYQFLTTATQLQAVSTDANDSAGGTGAQVLVVNYLDSNWDEQIELIPLNGLTPVNTANQILRINACSVLSVGSSNTHLGDISISDGGNIIAFIKATEFRSRLAIYSVPRNKNALVKSFSASSGRNDEIQVNLRGIINDINLGNQLFTKGFSYQNNQFFLNALPANFPERVDLNITAIKTGAAGDSRITVTLELEVYDL